MKYRLAYFGVILLICCSWSSTTPGMSFFGYEQWGGNWHDIDKTAANRDDDWLCWAAAAANILAWGNWGTPAYNTAATIFERFQQHWTNAGGMMDYGWRWWLNGWEPPSNYGGSIVNVSGEGGYWMSYNFFDYFAQEWAWDESRQTWGNGGALMTSLERYLREGYGITLGIYSKSGWGHALTVWGYEYDPVGNYTGLWVTDSDDYLTQLKLLPIRYDSLDNLWYLDSGYRNALIGEVTVLKIRPEHSINPIPEPSVFWMIILGLACFKIMRFKKND